MTETRNQIVAIRLSETEKLAVRTAAAQQDMSMADYIRALLLAQEAVRQQLDAAQSATQ